MNEDQFTSVMPKEERLVEPIDDEHLRQRVLSITSRATVAVGVHDGDVLDGEQGSQFLDTLLHECEKQIASICKRYNRFGLLVFIHATAPTILVTSDPQFDPDSQVMFRRTILAAMKYASADKDAEVVLRPEEYAPSYVAGLMGNGVMQEVIQLEYLVSVYSCALNARAVLGKGGRVQVSLDTIPPFKTVADESLRKLVGWFDRRVIKESATNLFAFGGLFAPTIQSADPALSIPVVQLDWDKLREEPAKIMEYNSLITFRTVDATSPYLACLPIRSDIHAAFGHRVYVEDLFAFLIACLTPPREAFEAERRLPGCGYQFVPKDVLLEHLSEAGPHAYASLFNKASEFGVELPVVLESMFPRWWIDNFERILGAFSFHWQSANQAINVRTEHPCFFLFELENNTIFVDLNLVVPTIAALWYQVDRGGGRAGHFKGKEFERWVHSLLTKRAGCEHIWEPSRGMEGPIGSKASTDVDVLIGKGKLTFLISCKAYKTSDALMESEGQAVWERWLQCKGWLREAEELAKYLAANATELGIPPEYHRVVPLVCTVYPEYFYEDRPELVLWGDIPRVATLPELFRYFTTFDTEKESALARATWTFSVAPH